MNDFEKSGEFMLAKNDEGKAVVLRATDEGSLLASGSTLEISGEDSSVDVAGSYLLAKNPEGQTVVIRATNEGKLLIEGGGGGGMPAAHAETHLPETGSDPLPTANASRWGLTKVSNALTSTETEISASADAVRRANSNANNKLPLSGGDVSGFISRTHGAVSLREYVNVEGSFVGGGVGAMRIKLPQRRTNTELSIIIEGYDHLQNTGYWRVEISFFVANSNVTPFIYPNAIVTGNSPFDNITLAEDAISSYIILGTITTTWTSASISITSLIAGSSTASGWGANWEITRVTDTSSLINVNNVPLKIVAMQEYVRSFIVKGTGSPEGVVTASPGRVYENTNGGANTTLYVKESGTGNTGWVAK